LTWLDWQQANRGLTTFTAALIRLRQQIPALTGDSWWEEGDGNSNGNLKLLMNDGLISRNLMEIVGLNVGNYIVGQIFGDDEV
ncbi:hypothetical protein MJM83_34975, partial [Salmonella enterica subsp. enterica serovar Montevideo]|nr:hypothetical protein [Salmonella enterica subsp. enterica serovar Montevideo]